MSKFWGATSPAVVEVAGCKPIERPILKTELSGTEIELYRHPELFITVDVEHWYGEYSYYEKTGGSSIKYPHTNENYHIAAGIYETHLHKFSRSK